MEELEFGLLKGLNVTDPNSVEKTFIEAAELMRDRLSGLQHGPSVGNFSVSIAKMDELAEKIEKKGLCALSQEDLEYLFNLSKSLNFQFVEEHKKGIGRQSLALFEELKTRFGGAAHFIEVPKVDDELLRTFKKAASANKKTMKQVLSWMNVDTQKIFRASLQELMAAGNCAKIGMSRNFRRVIAFPASFAFAADLPIRGPEGALVEKCAIYALVGLVVIWLIIMLLAALAEKRGDSKSADELAIAGLIIMAFGLFLIFGAMVIPIMASNWP